MSEKFLTTDVSFREFFKGYNVRGLEEARGMPRADFYREALALVRASKEEALAAGHIPVEAEAAQLRAVRQLGEGSLFFFCVFVLGLGYVNNDYGYRLCQDVQEHKWGRMWIIAREHLKSTVITCASTLWEVLQDPEQTYCIYSYKQEMAETFLRQIRMWCENNALLRTVWSDRIWANPAKCHEDAADGGRGRSWVWTSTQLEFRRQTDSKEKTIEAAGIVGSSKTGYHFSRQIFDDVETAKYVETPEAIEKLYMSFSMAFNTGQTQHLDFCIIGTFYAKADIYAQAIKNRVVEEAVVQPCVSTDGVPLLFSLEDLKKKHRQMGPSVFATQMMCNPSFSTMQAFDPAWWSTWAPNPEGLNVYVVVDPSSGRQTSRHDYTAIWTIGVDGEGKLMCLDLYRDKAGMDAKYNVLCSLHQEYRVLGVFYEQVGMQQDIAFLQMLMEKHNFYFSLTPYSPLKWGKKDGRISKLLDAFQQGKVWMPKGSRVRRNWEGREVDMVDEFYREEYLGYPTIPHDDALDCLASAWMLVVEKYIQLPMGKAKRGEAKGQAKASYDPFEYAEAAAPSSPSWDVLEA